MLPYRATDLARAFRTVRANTLKAVADLQESQFDFAPAPGTRTVRQLLTHIALGDSFAWIIQGEKRTSLDGVNFMEIVGTLMAEEQKPRTKAELTALLTERGDAFAAWLESLSDEFLAQGVAYPAGMQPASKTRFEMLLSVKEHEMHHRGQLMLIQRMVGVVPHLTREMQERFASAQR